MCNYYMYGKSPLLFRKPVVSAKSMDGKVFFGRDGLLEEEIGP